MSALGTKMRRIGGGRVAFWCPGCDSAHQIRVEGAAGGWEFDGNADAPTFSPSILVNGGRVNGRFVSEAVCHSFVRAGQIEFLGDCTHAFAGQTVALPDWPAGGGDF